jgi:hypothetical protein
LLAKNLYASADSDGVLVIIPEDGENKIVFGINGERLWMKDEPACELVKKLRLRLRHAPNGFAKVGL